MTKEDALKGLRVVADWHYGKYEQTHEEDYLNDGDFLTAVANMLKAQEAKVKTKCSTGMTHWYTCCGCDTSVNKGDKYCRMCGRELIWNG